MAESGEKKKKSALSPFTVKIAGASYFRPEPQRDTLGRLIKKDGEPVIIDVREDAVRGDHIMLTESQARRLQSPEIDAVVPGHVALQSPESVATAGARPITAGSSSSVVRDETGEAVPLTELDDSELVDYLKPEEGRPPSVDAVVQAAGSDPVLAQRLIDAEGSASGGEPRSTLVERLQKVVDAE
jgi:hypothetical protein